MSIGKLTDAEIIILSEHPTGTMAKTFLSQWHGCDVNEVLPKCIADVFITGHIVKQGLKGEAAANQIIQYGFAGTRNAANAILSVGRSVGRHFEFLTENNQPTDYFSEYFNS